MLFDEHTQIVKPPSPEDAEKLKKLFSGLKKYNTGITITFIEHKHEAPEWVEKLIDKLQNDQRIK